MAEIEPPVGVLNNTQLTELLVRAYGHKDGVYFIAVTVSPVLTTMQMPGAAAAAPMVGYQITGVELHKQTLAKRCPPGMGVDAAKLAKGGANG